MTIRDPLLGAVALIFMGSSALAIEIKKGTSVDAASEAMKTAGYLGAAMAMAPIDRENHRLEMWSVDEGYLIALYSRNTKKILGLTYWLSDERAKATRKEFEMEVKSFNTDSGVLTIQVNRPKREQVGDAKR